MSVLVLLKASQKKHFAWQSGCGVWAEVQGSDPSHIHVQKCPGLVKSAQIHPAPHCSGQLCLCYRQGVPGQLLIRTLVLLTVTCMISVSLSPQLNGSLAKCLDTVQKHGLLCSIKT